MYAIAKISSIEEAGALLVGVDSFFTALETGNTIIVGEEVAIVEKVISDLKFRLSTALASASVGDVIYVEDRCIFLKYQIKSLDYRIVNYDFDQLGIKRVKEGTNELEYSESNSTLNALISLKNSYQRQLDECEANANGGSVWLTRRYEYGTL